MKLTFVIPRNLWISANRSTQNHGHTAALRRKLHDIASTEALDKDADTIATPVRATWEVHYPKGVSWKHGDPTNAAPLTKALLDGVVKCGILPGDGPLIVKSETFQRGPDLPNRDSPHEIDLYLFPEIAFKETP